VTGVQTCALPISSAKVLSTNLEITRLRGRPRNRWQDEVRKDGRLAGITGWRERVHNREESPENGKESSHSARANERMNVQKRVDWETQLYSSLVFMGV
jgi:hypothetical protein